MIILAYNFGLNGNKLRKEQKELLKIDYQLKLLDAVLSLSYDDDSHILLADNSYKIFFYSVKNRELILGKKVSKNPQSHHIYSKAIATSKQGFFLISEVGKHECVLYQINQGMLQLIDRAVWHKMDISASDFCSDSSLVATGGEDGRVYVYNTEGFKFYALCPVQSDYISCIRFDAKNTQLAFASYNCKLIIYNLKTFEVELEIETPSVCVDMLFYENDQKLFYICKEGQVVIFDLKKRENQIQQLCDSWLHCCLLNQSQKYAIIAGRDNKLWIYSLYGFQDTIEIELPESGVSFLENVEGYLCVCFTDGKMIFIHQEYEKEEFLRLLDESKYIEAKKFAEKENIFLKLEDKYSKVGEEQWREVKEQIVQLLYRNQIEEATRLAADFLDVPHIRAEFNQLLEQKQFLKSFLKAIEDGKYQKAYQIAQEKSSIRGTSAFFNLEEFFERLLETCKKMLAEDYENQIYRVKKLLQPFSEVPSKKERVQIILENYLQYESIAQAIKNQDHFTAFNLGQQYPFLKITKPYKIAFNFYKDMFLSVKSEATKGLNPDLESKIEILGNLEYFRDEVLELKKLFEVQQEFIDSCKNQNYNQCYQILDQHPSLVSSSCYLEMENFILEIFKKATDLAQNGKTSETYDLLSQFFSLPRWKNRLDNIFQIAYIYEMKITHDCDWEATLRQYCDAFGKNTEIYGLCESKGILNIYDRILENQNKKDGYLKTIIVRKKNA